MQERIGCYKGRGTIPDYEVAPEIKDVLQGRDVQLDVAIKFINNKIETHNTSLKK